MINILDEMKNDFLVYAQEVNQNRAFADARDGIKPGMRATLWEMYTKGYFSSKPHVKSAKVSGGTIATWWPHGDGSIYEVIVRMSQPWINNICEIDFHGANGSLLGGPEAASSRYTECRLSNAVEDGFFTNIKKDVVDMIPNFSEDEKWPSVFPAIFPRLLINGTSGIGYTIANDWLPHNLSEVTEKVKEYLSTGNILVNDLAPDFPTGGIIINKSDLHTIYETGKGSVILRGKAEVIDKYIKITELPYQVYAEPFIQEIKDSVNSGTLVGIEDIYNKSDDNGLLIEIECSIDPNIVLQKLYKLTDLQCAFSANQMALVDGVPQMLNLLDYIKVYIDHNITCIQREYKFDLNKAEARKEIVDGLIRAISIIDDIIKTIKAAKSSESAKQDLISQFSFSENQAKAIVDMRLGRLANLEINELNNELKELIKTIDKCNKIINSDKLQKKEFLSRLEDFTNKYGWQRRTEVVDIDVNAEKQLLKTHSASMSEEYMICLTKNNCIKRVALNNYKPDKKAISEADEIISAVKLDIKDRVILISETGMMYKLDVKKLDLCSMNSSGQELNDLVHDKIIKLYTGNEEEQYLIFLTKNGLAKKIESKVVFELSKLVGAPVMKVQENDSIKYSLLVNDDESFVLNNGKKNVKIEVSSLIAKGRSAGGIQAIKLSKNVAGVELVC